MRRDSKGRFTKALVKTKPQVPTDVKLERKLIRINDTAQKVQAAKRLLALEAIFILACFGLGATGSIIGSASVSAASVLGFLWRFGELREANYQYWKLRASHHRLLRDAGNLTNKLLAEEGVIEDDTKAS